MGTTAVYTPAPHQPPAGNNVDKIRDILFGSHIRDYESRFERLEETLLKETSDLRETTRKRLDGLESYMRKEFETLSARIRTEREERSGAVTQLSKDLKDLSDSTARRMTDISDLTTNGQAKLHDEILTQSKTLSDELRSKEIEIIHLLERRFQELRKRKTDRAALSAMLTEVALRLNDQFTMPSADE